jgi:hypothetical protein
VDRRAVAVLAVAPFVTLAGVLRQLPGGTDSLAPMPWPHAAGHAALLLGLMAAHAWGYAQWQPHAPNRLLVNEFLTRMWFVLFGLILVGLHGDYGSLFFLLAAPWAVASWCTHYLVLRGQGAYSAGGNLAMLGLFLLGLALMALVCVKLTLGDADGAA